MSYKLPFLKNLLQITYKKILKIIKKKLIYQIIK